MKKLILLLAILGLAFTATAQEKIYDPMDVFKRDVPPNIYVVVDNSGSMYNSDTDNKSINTYIYYKTIYPGITDTRMYDGRGCYNRPSRFGTYWSYNVSSEYGVRTFAEAEAASDVGNQTRTFDVAVTGTGNISFVSLDIMFDDVDDYVDDLSGVTSIKLIHPDGRTIEMMDVIRGKYNQTLKNVTYYNSESRDWSSTHGRYIYHKTLHLALGGAPVDDTTATEDQKYFRGLPKAGTWQVQVSHSGSDDLYIRGIRVDANPKLDKNTVMKSVLEDVFRQSRSARFAFGAYQTWWADQGWERLPDGNGTNIYAHYASGSNSAYYGSEILEGFPDDPLATETNKDAIIDWVNMDVNLSNAGEWNYGANPRPRDIYAVTYTPIGGTFRDAYTDLKGVMGNDPSWECRIYSIIYLTDGYCTRGDCGDDYITGKIGDIYKMHTVPEDLNGDGAINSDDFLPTSVYIIGFAMGTNSTTLNKYAAAGHTDGNPDMDGFQAYMPSDAESLLQVFRDAIADASTQTFTGETQAIPVNLNHELQNKADENGQTYLLWQKVRSNAIVQSYFTFSDRGGFKGHVKTYGILKPDGYLLGNNQYRPLWDVSDWEEIPRDGYGQPLAAEPEPRRGTVDERIDNIRKYITPDETQENNVGGAVTPVPFRETFRCIVTPESTSAGAPLVYLNNYAYNKKVFRYVPDAKLVSFVQGRLGFNDEAETIAFIDFIQTKTFGDSTFSTPAVVGPAESYYKDDSYEIFENLMENRQKVIYIGANDGMLHCLDAHTGDELWALIPPDLFPKLRILWEEYKTTGDLSGQPDPKGTNLDAWGRRPHNYFLASSPRFTTIMDTGGDGKTILTIGEGAGGNSYTTLDITDPTISGFGDGFYPGNDTVTPDNPHDNPYEMALQYDIVNDGDLFMWCTAGEGSYANMGETWSTPSFTRYDLKTFVGYFGSGYAGHGGYGNELYVIDLATGAKLDSKSLPSDRAIMCSPGALTNKDGKVFGVYFGDTKGGLWRYVPHTEDISASKMEKIFQAEYNSTIFDTPGMLLDSSGVVWVATGEMGTEAGAYVVDNSVLYTVKDDAGYDVHPAPVYTPSEMIDMNAFESSYGTNEVIERSEIMGPEDKGMFYQLPTRETLFTSPIMTGYMVNDQSYITTLFLTYSYPEPGNYCNLGDANLYIFGLGAMFIVDEEEDGDAANLVGEGKPGSPFESNSGDIWLNTPAGPVRVVNAQGQGLQTGAAQDIDVRSLGRSGGWYTK